MLVVPQLNEAIEGWLTGLISVLLSVMKPESVAVKSGLGSQTTEPLIAHFLVPPRLSSVAAAFSPQPS